MNNKKLQIALLVLFIVVAGGLLYYGIAGNSGGNSAPERNVEAQTVQILKYSDYQCPACKLYIPLQENLKREFGDKVQIEYRHFPLSGHRFAELAARSVEAARNQDSFYEMHDKIFQYQEVWSRGDAHDHFEDFAREIGLDMDRFLADLESDEVRQRVESQRQEGIRRQVNATPTYFINGQRLRQNPQSYEQFKSIVELYMYRSN